MTYLRRLILSAPIELNSIVSDLIDTSNYARTVLHIYRIRKSFLNDYCWVLIDHKPYQHPKFVV